MTEDDDRSAADSIFLRRESAPDDGRDADEREQLWGDICSAQPLRLAAAARERAARLIVSGETLKHLALGFQVYKVRVRERLLIDALLLQLSFDPDQCFRIL